MFDFSFGELALIVLVALLVVGPKDLPVVIRTIGRWAGQFKSIADEFKEGFKSVMDESSIKEISEDVHMAHEEVQYIRDERGNMQRVYDISDFLDERERSTKILPEENHKD